MTIYDTLTRAAAVIDICGTMLTDAYERMTQHRDNMPKETTDTAGAYEVRERQCTTLRLALGNLSAVSDQVGALISATRPAAEKEERR